MIDCFFEGTAGFLRDDRHDLASEFRMAVQPGPDGGAAESHLAQRFLGTSHSGNAQFNLPCIPAEFLTQPYRRCVWKVSPADFDNLVELPRLLIERLLQPPQGRDQ